jgi:hypothetical protein
MRNLYKIGLLLLLIVITLFALQKLYDHALRHNVNLKLSSVALDPPKAEILFMGPCEAEWNISPALLDPLTSKRSYNLGLTHSDFADNLLHLHQYLKFNPPPEYIFIYVTPESFDPSCNGFNTYRFAPYMQDTLMKRVVAEFDPHYYKWTVLPFLRYAYYNSQFSYEVAQGLKHLASDRKHAYYGDGFVPPAKNVFRDSSGTIVSLYKHNVVYKWEPRRERYLRQLIKLGKKAGSQVLLYESPQYAGTLKFQPNRSELLEKIKGLAEEEKVTFINFENISWAQDVNNFNAVRNFSMPGVIAFNEILAAFIRNLNRSPVQSRR